MLDIIAPIYKIEDIEKLHDVHCTSVLVGAPFYSVRSTSHFTLEELKEIRNKTSMLHMNMYVLCNRFFIEKELEDCRTFLAFLKELDVDGIYFTDMGVFEEARNLGIKDKMIYNPDTILTNANDIQMYLNLGLKMVTISKEITIEDIIKIGKKVQGEMELIVHGRLNMMHSKRTLVSNYMKFLNKEDIVKNRKDLYLCEENREEHMPVIEDEHGTHVFTGFTLCSFEELDDIIKSVSHIRMEGMFNTIDEICDIVKDYIDVANNPAKGREMYQMYKEKYPNQNITKGFLYKKTGLLK